MKYLLLTFSITTLFCTSCSKTREPSYIITPEGHGIAKADSFGIKLAIQTNTFNEFTLVDIFETAKELDIKYLEVYPGHKLGGKWGDKSFDFNLSIEEQLEIKSTATKNGIKIVGLGIFMTKDIEDWQILFEFATTMELEYITCQPEYEHLDAIEKLAEETGIKVGIHNYIQPSNYWSTDILLSKIKGRSHLVGACADVGHWNREGFDQIECLEELNGRIVSVHLKDIEPKDEKREEQLDVAWGEGVLDIDAILIELKAQKFNGYLAIEYENNWEQSLKDLENSLLYYDLVCERIF